MEVQDSTYHAAVAKGQKDTVQPENSLPAKGTQKEESNGRQVYIRLGIAVLVLALLVVGLLRIRSKSKQS